MKFGVVVFPGSNCDQDMVDALNIMQSAHQLDVVKLWHKDHDLQNCDFIILPGGFAYGDYLRSGAIARFSPIMREVEIFAKGGGYVFGVCNGFQVLCEAGLLEGTLRHNSDRKFLCRNVHISTSTNNSILSRSIEKNKALKIPVANGEGNYFAHDDTIRSLKDNDQIIFRYCDENGDVTVASNPNGSIDNIAGICNKGRNVFGMMPHPERAVDQHLGNTDGRMLFESMLSAVEA
ncbi:MAG: phosphoribosylformylglycinamidine synthase subunit PurQ [Bacteroidia bacterium]|nr:phosphoribosylformylglycinamidine synthase subunit PurQ [Bacteroidia bacterium]